MQNPVFLFLPQEIASLHSSADVFPQTVPALAMTGGVRQPGVAA
jgi:hypothetical protein